MLTFIKTYSRGLILIGYKLIHNIYVPSFFRFALPVRKVMESLVSIQLDALVRRLNEAERRAKLLNNEVKRIKQEIVIIRSSVGTLPSTSSVTSTLSSTSVTSSLPSTSVITTRKKSTRCLSTDSDSDTDTADGPPLQNKKNKASFKEENGYVVVYTDGACENNGKVNAKAGLGVWFGHNHPLNISKPVDGKATNNTAEIQACIEALKLMESQGVRKVNILTDSQFTMNCMTKWISRWKKNNWMTASKAPVINKEDLQKLDEIIKRFEHVLWTHIPAHNGIEGNEQADMLAKAGARRYTRS